MPCITTLQIKLPRVSSIWALNISRYGVLQVLWAICSSSSMASENAFILTFKLNFPSSSLKPFPFYSITIRVCKKSVFLPLISFFQILEGHNEASLEHSPLQTEQVPSSALLHNRGVPAHIAASYLAFCPSRPQVILCRAALSQF